MTPETTTILETLHHTLHQHNYTTKTRTTYRNSLHPTTYTSTNPHHNTKITIKYTPTHQITLTITTTTPHNTKQHHYFPPLHLDPTHYHLNFHPTNIFPPTSSHKSPGKPGSNSP